jgi:hypothetical protein
MVTAGLEERRRRIENSAAQALGIVPPWGPGPGSGFTHGNTAAVERKKVDKSGSEPYYTKTDRSSGLFGNVSIELVFC